MTVTDVPMRVYRRCQVAKPATQFSKKASRVDGLQVNCKPCAVVINREWRQANPGRGARHTRDWKSRNPEKAAAMQARQRESGYARNYARRTRYGLTPEQFDVMLAEQDGRCASCGVVEPDARWHVDHDHSCCPGSSTCGRCVRGILCFRCNAGIGVFRDNATALRQAADYLDRTRKVRELEDRPPLPRPQVVADPDDEAGGDRDEVVPFRPARRQ